MVNEDNLPVEVGSERRVFNLFSWAVCSLREKTKIVRF